MKDSEGKKSNKRGREEEAVSVVSNRILFNRGTFLCDRGQIGGESNPISMQVIRVIRECHPGEGRNFHEFHNDPR